MRHHLLRAGTFMLVLAGSGLMRSEAQAITVCSAGEIRASEGCAAPPSTTPCTFSRSYDIGPGPCVIDFEGQPIDINRSLTVLAGMKLYASDVKVDGSINGDDAASIDIFATGDPDGPGALGNIVTTASITSDGNAGSGGGSISLTSYQGSMTIGGSIHANGASGEDGGSIELRAARSVTINEGLTCDGANEDGGGGAVSIVGTVIQVNAPVVAQGDGNGGGGTITIAANPIAAPSSVSVNAALSTEGAGGTVGITASGTITIDANVSANGVVAGNEGGTVEVDSLFGTVTVSADVTANEGDVGDGGGDVSLTGCTVAVESGGSVSANGGGTTTLTVRETLDLDAAASVSATGGVNQVFYRADDTAPTPPAIFTPPLTSPYPQPLSLPVCSTTCGNETVEAGEACDDGQASVCGCDAFCQISPTSCVDGNVCTTDPTCHSTYGCLNQPGNQGTTCDDANVCTADSSCSYGSCTGPVTVVCEADSNVCTKDFCDPVEGCVHEPRPDGFSCDTGDPCWFFEHCIDAVCVGFVPNPIAAACDDGDACTQGDQCNTSTGACTPGGPLNCDDGDTCTDDSCNPASGCVNANNTAPCDDGSACTVDDACSGGQCSGTTVSCDDTNVCTDDSCNPASGCVNANNTAPCDDGNECTTTDVCGGGACAGTCNDGASCLELCGGECAQSAGGCICQ